MPQWLLAGTWGAVGGSALLVGALIGWGVRISQRVVAGAMGFGAGVLLSALSFDLMEEAAKKGGLAGPLIGFVAGAVVYSAANYVLAKKGAQHRKRSHQEKAGDDASDSGLAIAVGALLDGIPESMAIGVSLLGGKGVSMVTVAAVFLSNVPESLSSSAGMKSAGRSRRYVFGVWFGIAIASAIAAAIGNVAFQGVSPVVIASVIAVAAGAILAMLADTMVPEAAHETHALTGLIVAAGFLAAFVLTRLEKG